jgi:aminopeptidase N
MYMKIKLVKTLKPMLLALTALPFLSCSERLSGSDSIVVSPGVSEELATYRKQQINRLAYKIDLSIPAKKEEPVLATETIFFQLAENKYPLQIDFKEESGHLTGISVNEKTVPVKHRQEHILIPTEALKEGSNKVEIDFIAGDLSLNRNEDYLYTLLVPDRARTVFPVFDQPDLKASFQLSLKIPSEWTALTNAPLVDSLVSGNFKTLHFAASDTISTYLFSFAAGNFERVSREVEGTLMHFYHRETDQEKLSMSIEPVFQLHAEALRFMEAYTLIPYPFQKFDFIAIPDFQYGGMEHVGAIDYKAASLFLDAGATKDQHISRSSLIAHETAHMWFGDLVTMQWFNDVWMKEVFANFMADKITQVSLENTNYDLKFLIDHFPAAYAVDRTEGANSIRQPLENLQDAGSLYGGIIYHKAPVMMRQLERLIGKENLQEGLQEYLQRYAHSNATWPQLIQILDARTNTDLAAWNQVWVNEPGRPVFDWELETKEGKIMQLNISQQAEDGSERIWPQLFEIALVYPDKIKELTVQMDRPVLALKEAVGEEVPLFVLFNSSGQGYGVFPLDEQMSADKLYLPDDPVARASAYINLYENMLNGRSIAPGELLQLYRSGLDREPEELNLKLLTGYVNDIYWRLLRDEERRQMAPELEKEIWNALQQTSSVNTKKLLFKAYKGIAFTDQAQERLYRIWKEEKAPVGVKLSEDDYTSLALALAVRDYPAAANILETQLTRIQNPDRRKRLQFMMPALSAEEQVRDSFFESLKKPQNREKEAWVQAALSYLHHPLRRPSSQKHLQESLDLLAEIQQTGDIFFPHAWLKVTFGSYVSPEAVQLVRDFLKAHPDYNPKLRAKILQAADDLFRAENLLRGEDS